MLDMVLLLNEFVDYVRRYKKYIFVFSVLGFYALCSKSNEFLKKVDQVDTKLCFF